MSSTHLESDLAHTWVYIEGPKGVQGAGFSANGTHNTFNIMKLNKQTGLQEVEVGEEAKTVQLGDRIRTSQAVNPTKNLGKQSHWGQTGKRQQETHRQAQVKWIRAGLKAQTHNKGESSRESFFFEAFVHLAVTTDTNNVFTPELQQLSANDSNLANNYTSTSHNKRASVLHDWGAQFATKQSLINM